MKRYEINKTINFRSLVPMKTLLFDLLNQEMFSLDHKFFIESQKIVRLELEESIREYKKFKEEIERKNTKIIIMKELDVINLIKIFLSFFT